MKRMIGTSFALLVALLCGLMFSLILYSFSLQRAEFFSSFVGFLSKLNDFKDILVRNLFCFVCCCNISLFQKPIPDAFVPIIALTFNNDHKIDLLFANVPLDEVPSTLKVTDQMLDDMDQKSVLSVNGYFYYYIKQYNIVFIVCVCVFSY